MAVEEEAGMGQLRTKVHKDYEFRQLLFVLPTCPC